MKLATLLILLVLIVPATAQHQNNIWYCGSRAGIDFNGSTPVVLTDGAIVTKEGCATVADRTTGRLLFYASGDSVFNRQHRLMPNGTGLAGHWSSTQAALIVPMPGDSLGYYIFTADAAENGGRNGISYSMVDMRLDGGRGDIMLKNQSLLRPSLEKLTAIRHCNGEDYWVIAHGRPTTSNMSNDSFYVWQVTRSGISTPLIWRAGITYSGNDYGSNTGSGDVGYLKASPDGSMLAVASHPSPDLHLLGFNRADGSISNSLRIKLPDDIDSRITGPYGLSFSPDNSKLYLSVTGSESRLYQYDVSIRSKGAIDASLTLIATRTAPGSREGWGALQAGPDGKIYLAAAGQSWLHVIAAPNARGAACLFQQRAIDLGAGVCGLGLPNMIDSDLYPPVAAAGLDVRICQGSSVILSPSGGARYIWQPNTSLSCTDCPNPIASPTISTTYHVEIIGPAGCSTADSVTVTVIAPPIADAGRDTTICRGDTLQLVARGGSVYKWAADQGLSCIDCFNPRVAPLTTTRYIVTVADSNGCQATDSILVRVAARANVYAGRDTVICGGGSVQLQASQGAGFSWSPSSTLSCDTCANPIATPVESTTYTLTVWNEAGCSSTDAVTVTVLPAPALSVSPDLSVCAGDSARLSVSGTASYRWRPSPDLSCLDCPDPFVHPSETTTYHVRGINEHGCVAEDSVVVTVHPLPRVELAGDSAICAGGSARIAAAGTGSYRWWTTQGPLSCENCAVQTVTPLTTTTYYVEIKGEGNCTAIDSFTVRVLGQPELVVSGGGEICAGGSLPLSASGASSYRWSPATGLDCFDCATPIASPATTTLYRVIGGLPGGCADTAEVLVRVSESILAQASMERNVRVLPGQLKPLHLRLDRSVTTDSISLTMTWNPSMAVITSARLMPSVAADGWSMQIRKQIPGEIELYIRRPAAGTLGPGEIMAFDATGYLGDSLATEIPFALSMAATSCASISDGAGQLLLDSICGLNFRLIEASPAKLRLEAPTPNPVTGDATVRYSLPFDGRVEIVLIDPAGRMVRRLVEGDQPAGTAEVSLGAGELSSGSYRLRMRYGDSVLEQRVIIIQ